MKMDRDILLTLIGLSLSLIIFGLGLYYRAEVFEFIQF